jgi:hypothetical protein
MAIEPTVPKIANSSLYVVENQPQNINPLLNNDFVLKIHRTPHVNYFIQSVSIPGITLPAMQMPTPHAVIPIEANRPIYDNLALTFTVDEFMINYMEIVNWIRALGKPQGFNDYTNRFGKSRKPETAPFVENKYKDKYSDLSVFVVTSIKNPKVEFVFRDAWPVAISQIPFDTTQIDSSQLTATAFFAYTYFDIIRVDGQDTTKY